MGTADKKSSVAWYMWLITSLFYSFQFFLRSCTNAFSQQLNRDFGLDASQLGKLTSAYYWPYSLCQVPVGIALDVFGPKKVLRSGVVICVLGSFCFAFSNSLPMAFLGRFLIGMGAAASFTGSISMNSLWFSPANLAFAVGLLSAVGKLVGGALVNAAFPMVEGYFSWRQVVFGLSIWGLILSIFIWIFVKNGPKDHFQPQVYTFQQLRSQFLSVLKVKRVWAMGIYGYAIYLILSVFSDSYSIKFMCNLLQIDRQKAGLYASLVMVGSAIGASVLSYFSDKLQERRKFLRLASFLTLAISSVIFYMPGLPHWIFPVLLVSVGFFSGGQILIFVVSRESVPGHLTGMAVGITNGLLMLGGAAQNVITGSVIKSFAGNEDPSIFAYRMGFSTITLCFLAAFIISLTIDETHPQRKKIN